MKRLRFLESGDVSGAARETLAVVQRGGTVLIPTESYYGLGADPASPEGVAAVYRLKERPKRFPLPVLVADWQQLESLVVVPGAHRVRLSRTWPAAMTVILFARVPLAAAAGTGTLAVRIPAHDRLRALLYLTGPLTGTSANRHGRPPSVSSDAALASLAGCPDLVLDGGVTGGGPPSTLVDLTGPDPRILRAGSVPW